MCVERKGHTKISAAGPAGFIYDTMCGAECGERAVGVAEDPKLRRIIEVLQRLGVGAQLSHESIRIGHRVNNVVGGVDQVSRWCRERAGTPVIEALQVIARCRADAGPDRCERDGRRKFEALVLRSSIGRTRIADEAAATRGGDVDAAAATI